MTNSKNNDYYATIAESDSLNFRMFFKDFNGINAEAVFDKKSLENAKNIFFECNVVRPSANPNRYKTKYYDFHALKDTIIQDKQYAHYEFKSNNPKREKRKQLATNYYIIDTSAKSHKPYLVQPTAYEEWVLNKSIPNGLIKEMYQKNYEGTIVWRRTLMSYKTIDVKLVIPDECDYTDLQSTSNRN